jgi:hypothetical protein
VCVAEPRAVLFCGCKSAALVVALEEVAEDYMGKVCVGSRLDIREVLEREMGSVREEGTIVAVVSGSKSMAVDVRTMVCDVARTRKKGVTRLVDECFGW